MQSLASSSAPRVELWLLGPALHGALFFCSSGAADEWSVAAMRIAGIATSSINQSINGVNDVNDSVNATRELSWEQEKLVSSMMRLFCVTSGSGVDDN